MNQQSLECVLSLRSNLFHIFTGCFLWSNKIHYRTLSTQLIQSKLLHCLDVIFRKFFHRQGYFISKLGAAAYGNKPFRIDFNLMHFRVYSTATQGGHHRSGVLVQRVQTVDTMLETDKTRARRSFETSTIRCLSFV